MPEHMEQLDPESVAATPGQLQPLKRQPRPIEIDGQYLEQLIMSD